MKMRVSFYLCTSALDIINYCLHVAKGTYGTSLGVDMKTFKLQRDKSTTRLANVFSNYWYHGSHKILFKIFPSKEN